jgi:uncharacterized protein YbcV (DUF1398 family)
MGITCTGATTLKTAEGLEYLADTLRVAGVRRNFWSLPACQSLYLTEDGPVVITMGTPLAYGTMDVPAFDREAVIAALRTDQAPGTARFPSFWLLRGGLVAFAVM